MGKKKPGDIKGDCPKNEGLLVVNVENSHGKPLYGIKVKADGPTKTEKVTAGVAGPASAEFGFVPIGNYAISLADGDAFTGANNVAVTSNNANTRANPHTTLKPNPNFNVQLPKVTPEFKLGMESISLTYTITDKYHDINSGKLEVVDKNNTVVHSVNFAGAAEWKPGSHALSKGWDGKNANGKYILPAQGPYRVQVTVSDGVTLKHDEKPTKPTAVFDVKMTKLDNRFAPGREKIDLNYAVSDKGSLITSGKVEVLDRSDTVVYTAVLAAAKYSDGKHEEKEWWDGKKADGSYITFYRSPFKVKISVTYGAVTKSSIMSTKVELHSLKAFLRGPQLAKEGGAHRVYFEGNLRARPMPVVTNANFIVEATVRFKDKKGNPVTTPIPVDLEWAFKDPDCDLGRIRNGKAKTYVKNAIKYQKAATVPPGDNCHVDRGGKRGDGTHKYFTAVAAFNLSAKTAPNFHPDAKSTTETAGTFQVKTQGAADTLKSVAALHQLPEADLTAVNAGGAGPFAKGTSVNIPKQGKSAIEFATSNICNDSYAVSVKATDKDGVTGPKKELDTVTVWWRIRAEIVQEMRGHPCRSGTADLPAAYLPSNIEFVFPTVTAIAARTPVWPLPPARPLIRRQDYPVAPGFDVTYLNAIQAASYQAEYDYEASIHAGTGIQAIGAHCLRKIGNPNFTNVVVAGVTERHNTGGELGEGEGGGYNPTGTQNRIIIYDAPEVVHTFSPAGKMMTHEMGHLLQLLHQEADPTGHDPADPPATASGGCIMRNTGKSDHFCGKCLLFLWRWNIHAVGPGALP